MNTTLLAFNVMGPEMIWIVAILVLLFGAKKLPQLARGIGESIGEFKKARQEFDEEVAIGEKSAADQEQNKDQKSTASNTASSTAAKDANDTDKSQSKEVVHQSGPPLPSPDPPAPPPPPLPTRPRSRSR